MTLAPTVMARMADMPVAVINDIKADRREPIRQLGANTIGYSHTRNG